MARIATLCTDERRGTRLVDMAAIRWYRMSAELAALGHEVDILHGRYKWRIRQPTRKIGPRLREVPLRKGRRQRYDVVKTLFHRGFETAERFGLDDHPFVISKLGSVVAPEDRDGIYFYGRQRERLFETQQRIAERSRYVTLLTQPALELWREAHGPESDLLLVPGAADAEIPPRGDDPYPDRRIPRVLFAGNFYSSASGSQPEAHRTVCDKLNRLGAALRRSGIGLYVLGPGDANSLDHHSVQYLGTTPYRESWRYLQWADVGLVVSAGPFMHNNESTKIYHYLRVGLPVVSESGFPNDHLVSESGHGHLIDPGDLDALEEAVRSSLERSWERDSAIRFILRRHTWRHRAQVYHEIIRDELGG